MATDNSEEKKAKKLPSKAIVVRTPEEIAKAKQRKRVSVAQLTAVQPVKKTGKSKKQLKKEDAELARKNLEVIEISMSADEVSHRKFNKYKNVCIGLGVVLGVALIAILLLLFLPKSAPVSTFSITVGETSTIIEVENKFKKATQDSSVSCLFEDDVTIKSTAQANREFYVTVEFVDNQDNDITNDFLLLVTNANGTIYDVQRLDSNQLHVYGVSTELVDEETGSCVVNLDDGKTLYYDKILQPNTDAFSIIQGFVYVGEDSSVLNNGIVMKLNVQVSPVA